MLQNSILGFAQIIATYELPKSLSEISGLEKLNDTLLVGMADGGNKAELFLMNCFGKVIRTIEVENAENIDWEDLANDGEFLYIGDFGNNLNDRKNLCVYKIAINSMINGDVVKAEKINYSYAEQITFPPAQSEMRFDAEAMLCYQNEIWIFTKTKTQPWDGKSWVYHLPNTPGTYALNKEREIFIGKNGWWSDAITAADYYNDTFYFLTYNRITKFKFAKNKFKHVGDIRFDSISQKESIVIINNKELFVADEKQALMGGGKLYKIKM